MEIRKSEVTKVIVDDEMVLVFPLCEEVDFFIAVVFLKDQSLLAAFSHLLHWGQY